VCRDGDAFAIYYAAYSNNHPEHELAMLVSLGEWGEVRAHFTAPDAPPWLEAAAPGALVELLARPWARDEFERFAAARGFL
jgi:hypothetical protein